MPIHSKIHWCDSTCNPMMGCNGCPLYPTTSGLVSAITLALAAKGIGAIKWGTHLYYVVASRDRELTHTATTLRLRCVWVNGDGLRFSELVRLPLVAFSSEASDHRPITIAKKFIMPLARRLARQYSGQQIRSDRV